MKFTNPRMQMDPNCTHVIFHNMIEKYGKVRRFNMIAI
jgi:hypothetical protein